MGPRQHPRIQPSSAPAGPVTDAHAMPLSPLCLMPSALLAIYTALNHYSSVTQAPGPRHLKRNEKEIELYSKATSGEITPRLRARVRW